MPKKRGFNSTLAEAGLISGFVASQPITDIDSSESTTTFTLTLAAPGAGYRWVVCLAYMKLAGATATADHAGVLDVGATDTLKFTIGNGRLPGEIQGISVPILADVNTAVTFVITQGAAQSVFAALGAYKLRML